MSADVPTVAVVSNVSTAWAVFSVLGGTIIGGIISTTVAFIVQKRGLAAAKKQRDEDKRDERRTLALNVFTKMIRLASNLEQLRQSVEGTLADAKAKKLKGPPWAHVKPIASLPGKIHFDPKELTEVMRLDFNLFNDLGPLDDVHNVIIEAFEIYRKDRGSLTDTLHADMDGDLGSTEFTAEDIKRLGPRMVALDNLVGSILGRTKHDSADAMSLLMKLQEALNKEYDMKLRLEKKPAPIHA